MAQAAVMVWVGAVAGQAGAMRVEAELVRALGAGRVRRAAACRDRRGGDGGVVEALIDAELATRRGECSLADLVELAARVHVEAGDDPVVRWWAGALVAERCGLDLDIAGAARAASLLAEVPDDTVVPVLVLWIRGRLRRLDDLVRLFGRDPDRDGSRRLRSLAIADFGRGGLPAEVAATRILGAATEALWLMEDRERNLAAAVDARAMVDPHSAWAPLLDVVLAMLAVGASELSMAERSPAMRREPRPASTLDATARVLRAMCALAGSAASPWPSRRWPRPRRTSTPRTRWAATASGWWRRRGCSTSGRPRPPASSHCP